MDIAEDVRVAVKHFVDDGGRNVLHREFIRRLCNICMERHLQQHVTKLIRQMIHIALIDRADCLVRFLNQIAAEGLMRLFAIPRAAIGLTQTPDGLHQMLQLGRRVDQRGQIARALGILLGRVLRHG